MQYFEIGERLQPNLANFNLDFLPSLEETLDFLPSLRSKCSSSDSFTTDELVKKTRQRLVFSTSLSVFRNQRNSTFKGLTKF